MTNITRRQFGKVAATTSALAGVSLPEFSLAQPKPQKPENNRQFPPGFVWGCATAAYQIEGGVHEGGRGTSIWDIFSHTPGKIANGDTGDVADDSYHLYKEDVRLLKDLGAGAYRMSIAWPRIFPNGTGQPNPAGLDYYKRVLDELLANNITPYVTLFHWDLPAALPGGWQSRATALAFADYAGYVARQLSDRVRHFMTTNEFVLLHRPGLQNRAACAGTEAAPGRGEPGAASRHPRAWPRRPGHPRQRARGPGGTGRERQTVFVPVIETAPTLRPRGAPPARRTRPS